MDNNGLDFLVTYITTTITMAAVAASKNLDNLIHILPHRFRNFLELFLVSVMLPPLLLPSSKP
jgi:hypothetical protein